MIGRGSNQPDLSELNTGWSGPHPIAKLQRYSGPGAPLREIIGLGALGAVGRWVLLDCEHWREIHGYDLLPAIGRKRPTRARCGVCRHLESL